MRTPARHSRPILALLLVLGIAAGGFAWLHSRRPAQQNATPPGVDADAARRLVEQLTALEARETDIAETAWAKELVAERCGEVFERLWDSLNASSNRLEIAAAFPFGDLTAPVPGPVQTLPHGIEIRPPADGGVSWSPAVWRERLDGYQRAGWHLEQCEFRHNRFDPDATGRPGQSEFYFSAHLLNPGLNSRAVLEGPLIVDWSGELSPEGLPGVKRVDAHRLTFKFRQGDPLFRRVLHERIQPPDKSFFIDPLITYDLDGDVFSEILLAARNLVFRREVSGGFKSSPLCAHPPGLIFTAVLGDFDGDRFTDYLCAKFDGLELFKGSPGGRFDEPGRSVWKANPRLKYGQVLTCGDIDGDGDLDVWLGQYKSPYERGQMPTPYYDANDGNPSFLLLNDGHGVFRDATAAAGLADKRWRRSYSGSFVDLDDDGDLDLLVVSDFAGVDCYENDGHGHFTDTTRTWVPDPAGFGMAHALADFNGDGLADLFVTGMHCSTALRISHLGLSRPDRPDYANRVSDMATGNKLFAGRDGGGFKRSPLEASVARSGWTWGCGALDFDNDGFPDLYVANGHETRQSVRDYDSYFWLHDIYVGNATDNPVVAAFFGSQFGRTRARGMSYGGYEKNRFFWNRKGTEFLETGYLMGVALETDSRCVVAEDLDGDGREDLIVTTFSAWPKSEQTLQVFQNQTRDVGSWVGVAEVNNAGTHYPPGTRVRLQTQRSRSIQALITGDSHRSQRGGSFHFGLGVETNLVSLEIRLPYHSWHRVPVPGLNQNVKLGIDLQRSRGSVKTNRSF